MTRRRLTDEEIAARIAEREAIMQRRVDRMRMHDERIQAERDVILDDFDRWCNDQALRVDTKFDGSVRKVMDDRALRLQHDGGFEIRPARPEGR